MADEYTSLDYTVSLHYDRRLYREDIAGSQAHARMLARQGIISADEANGICAGLDAIRQEIEDGFFPWRRELEDLHMNVEARLHDLIGETAGKLHTARSRNDQVATDMRLFVRRTTEETVDALRGMQRALASVAGDHVTDSDAGLHAPAAGAARGACPSPAGLRGDAGAGRRAIPAGRRTRQRVAARQRRAGGFAVPPRPGVGRARVGFRWRHGQQHGRRRRP